MLRNVLISLNTHILTRNADSCDFRTTKATPKYRITQRRAKTREIFLRVIILAAYRGRQVSGHLYRVVAMYER